MTRHLREYKVHKIWVASNYVYKLEYPVHPDCNPFQPRKTDLFLENAKMCIRVQFPQSGQHVIRNNKICKAYIQEPHLNLSPVIKTTN